MKRNLKFLGILIICNAILILVGCSRVSFLDEDGSEISEKKVFFLAKNVVTPSSDELKKEGYNFNYWSLQPEGTSYEFNKRVVKDLSLYAVYEKKAYTVQFFDEDHLIETVEVKYGDTISQFPDLKKEGYSLAWTTEDQTYFNPMTTIEQDLSLIANWDINLFKVSYLDEDGNLLCVQNVEYEESIENCLPEVKYGYFISDLFLDELHTIHYSVAQPVTDNLTLYCELSPKHYTVSFYSLGKLIGQQEVAYEDKVNLPSLDDRKDHIFKYWSASKNGTAFSENTPIREDLNLYGVWKIHLSFPSFLLKVFFPIICVVLSCYFLFWYTKTRKFEENISKLQIDVTSLKYEKQRYIDEVSSLKRDIDSLSGEKKQIGEKIEKIKGIASSETYIQKLEADILSKEKEKKDLQEKIEQLKQQENSLQSQISELKLFYGNLKDQKADNEILFKNASKLTFVFSHVTKCITDAHYAGFYPGDSEYKTTWYVNIYNNSGYSRKQTLGVINHKLREYEKELDLSNIRNEINRIVTIALENSIDFSKGYNEGYYFTDAVLFRMKNKLRTSENAVIREYGHFNPEEDEGYYFELEWEAKEKENKNKKSSEKNGKDSRQRTYSESDNGSTSFSEGLVKSLVIMKYDPKDRPTKEELIKKYKKLININHPDQYQNDDERKEYFEEETKKINVSFDYLMSDEGFGYKKKQK